MDFPPELTGIATSLSLITGRQHDREGLLQSIIKQVQGGFENLLIEGGNTQMIEEYQRACCTIGRDVRAILHDREIEGTAVALDDSGRLIIRSANEEHALSSADIIHLR